MPFILRTGIEGSKGTTTVDRRVGKPGSIVYTTKPGPLDGKDGAGGASGAEPSLAGTSFEGVAVVLCVAGVAVSVPPQPASTIVRATNHPHAFFMPRGYVVGRDTRGATSERRTTVPYIEHATPGL